MLTHVPPLSPLFPHPATTGYQGCGQAQGREEGQEGQGPQRAQAPAQRLLLLQRRQARRGQEGAPHVGRRRHRQGARRAVEDAQRLGQVQVRGAGQEGQGALREGEGQVRRQEVSAHARLFSGGALLFTKG
jgi:hypothetical protein